ncbi:MAG: hypothetical protein ACHQ1G_06745, partial [Planctomycetota bacterium]
MKRTHISIALAAMALLSFAQETPRPEVDTYNAIADAILATKHAETGIVKTILDGHLHAAMAAAKSNNHEAAAANMALFANEGDNAVGGIRKRLLEGGHHHNAEGEAKGVYEEGYVIVTKAQTRNAMEASASLRSASIDGER